MMAWIEIQNEVNRISREYGPYFRARHKGVNFSWYPRIHEFKLPLDVKLKELTLVDYREQKVEMKKLWNERHGL
jgi:hypothetical protein